MIPPPPAHAGGCCDPRLDGQCAAAGWRGPGRQALPRRRPQDAALHRVADRAAVSKGVGGGRVDQLWCRRCFCCTPQPSLGPLAVSPAPRPAPLAPVLCGAGVKGRCVSRAHTACLPQQCTSPQGCSSRATPHAPCSPAPMQCRRCGLQGLVCVADQEARCGAEVQAIDALLQDVRAPAPVIITNSAWVGHGALQGGAWAQVHRQQVEEPAIG